MTTRLKGFVVTLVEDVREDDAEAVMTALRMVRWVLSVQPVTADPGDEMIRYRVDTEWRKRIYELLRGSE